MSAPTGWCSPKKFTKKFTATITGRAFIDIKTTRTTTVTGDCESLPNPVVNVANFRKGGGSFSFTVRFNLVGDSFICANMGEYIQAWTTWENNVNNKANDENKSEKTVSDTAGAKCPKRENYQDERGCPKVRINWNSTRITITEKKEASVNIDKSVRSSGANCTFN